MLQQIVLANLDRFRVAIPLELSNDFSANPSSGELPHFWQQIALQYQAHQPILIKSHSYPKWEVNQ
ncbi:MAG: hypothetical protein BVN30_02585 [Proteobacteria bacterium ST_bin16]|nr:MAG: hypothetical protein BVN30_02585 [Proteobacteria bacterium ST_bin16]